MNKKTLIGHSLDGDLEILEIDPVSSNCELRDISKFDLFLKKVDSIQFKPDSPIFKMGVQSNNSSPGEFLNLRRKLKDLSREFLNAKIQEGQHSSIIDARVTLALYRMFYEKIELEIRCKEALDELKNHKETLSKANSSEAKQSKTSSAEKDGDLNDSIYYLRSVGKIENHGSTDFSQNPEIERKDKIIIESDET